MTATQGCCTGLWRLWRSHNEIQGAAGRPADRFPDNPNGSVESVAGLCDPSGRILGLMPHPERFIEPWHHPRWTRRDPGFQPDGLRLFRKAVSLFQE